MEEIISGLENKFLEKLQFLRNEPDDSENFSLDEFNKKQKDFINSCVQELMRYKDFFKHIFKTEKNSIYFVTQNGLCWRFKEPKPNEMAGLCPITHKVVFVGPEEISRVREMYKKIKFLDHDSLRKTHYDIKHYPAKDGLYPLEIGIVDRSAPIFDESEDRIMLKGVRQEYLDGGEATIAELPLHIGHHIVEIIK